MSNNNDDTIYGVSGAIYQPVDFTPPNFTPAPPLGGGSQPHYKQCKIQPIEFIIANGLDFLEGNVVKYVSRYKYKNGLEDLHKAKDYLEMLIAREEEK